MTTPLQDINDVVAQNAPAQKVFVYGLNENNQPELAKVINGSLVAQTVNKLSPLTVNTGSQLIGLTKTYQAKLTGTGAISCTLSLQQSNTDGDYEEFAQMTISGTTTAIDSYSWQSASPYFKYSVLSISGTGAAVACNVSAL